MKKLGASEPCPCGSGLKYKQCFWKKEFEWMQDERGNILKSIPMNPNYVALIEQERQEYIAKHGQEPDPESPLYPDLSRVDPEAITEEITKAMEGAGIRPELVYAFRRPVCWCPSRIRT